MWIILSSLWIEIPQYGDPVFLLCLNLNWPQMCMRIPWAASVRDGFPGSLAHVFKGLSLMMNVFVRYQNPALFQEKKKWKGYLWKCCSSLLSYWETMHLAGVICPGKEPNIYYFLTPLLADKNVTEFSIKWEWRIKIWMGWHWLDLMSTGDPLYLDVWF